MVYLDYAGAALPSISQQLQSMQLPSILANPHTTGPAASHTKLLLEQAKQLVLELLQGYSTDSHPGYDILFTSGTTEALRIIAEQFPWTCCPTCKTQSTLVYSNHSHTSVLGMRESAMAHGGTYQEYPLAAFVTTSFTSLQQQQRQQQWYPPPPPTNCSCHVQHLLVLPVECNFSGERPNLSRVLSTISSSSHWMTMLDIAKAASTSPINLHTLNPDMACLSFYKLFGTPTGLGALLVRRNVTSTLQQSSGCRYFGGGSVNMVLPTSVIRKEGLVHHGTPHFRGIASIVYGVQELTAIGGMVAIQQHTMCLANELRQRLRALRHPNGTSLVQIYGNLNTTSESGPTVTFNLHYYDGSFVGYNEVSKLAAIHSPPIQLRTGCFCNPGACQEALGLTDKQIQENYKVSGHICGDHIDIIHGRPTGAIRVSLGKDSIWEDIDVFVSFIQSTFVSTTTVSAIIEPITHTEVEVCVTELYIFPIKSCAAQRVSSWRMDTITGKMEWDREFALVDSSGTAMRLQTYPQMSQVRPMIALDTSFMTVTAPGMPNLLIDIHKRSDDDYDDTTVIQVCGNKCGVRLWADTNASDWFSNFLGVQCWLARHDGNTERQGVAFANEESLLLISEHAVDALNDVLKRQGQCPAETRHFRPNLVIRHVLSSQGYDHMEDNWKSLMLLRTKTQLNVVGECPRCAMVDVDPTSGTKGKTLQALADYRRRKGRIMFGIFLRRSPHDFTEKSTEWIKEGDLLKCQ